MQALTKKPVWIALALAAMIAAALLWWRQHESAPSAPVAPAVPVPLAQAPAPAPASASVPQAPAHPIDAAALAASGPDGAPPRVEDALIELLGRKTVLSMLQLDDFPRRFAATVDNLGRSSASSRLWPVNPTPGRFTVATRGEALVIGADNAPRYEPFVLMVESLDLQRAVALYKRLYPQIQLAYEGIGFPDRYFNDRLVEVIDLLLASPELDAPPRVVLPPIHGPVRPERPWVLYEFEAPELRALTTGQKILLRMGPVNARRLKARLAEIRALVAVKPVAR